MFFFIIVSLKIDFVSTNSAEHDDMPHHAAFMMQQYI